MKNNELLVNSFKNKPRINYTNKDYESLLADLKQLAQSKLPEWTDFSPSDPGVVLLECFAYLADIMLYYQDRIAQESFPHTAVEKRNVKNLLRLIGYEFQGALPARTIMRLDIFLGKLKEDTIAIQIEDGMKFFANSVEGIGTVRFMFHPGVPRVYLDNMKPGNSYEFFTFRNDRRSKLISLQETFGPNDKVYQVFSTRLQIPHLLKEKLDFTVRESLSQANNLLPKQERKTVVIHSSFLESISKQSPVVTFLVEHNKKIESIGNKEKIPPLQLYLPVVQAEKAYPVTLISEGIPSQSFPIQIYQIEDIKRFWLQDEIEVRVAKYEDAKDDDDFELWQRRPNFLDSGPSSPHYYMQLNEKDEPIIFFGDGVNGAIPPLGREIQVNYLVGIGEKGNIAKGLIRGYSSEGFYIERGALEEMRVVNITPAIGGKNPETPDEAIENAPRKFKTLDRAVTREDYEYLIRANFPEVQEVIVTRGSVYKITIYVLFHSYIEKDDEAVEQSLRDIQNFLEDYRMLTVLLELKRGVHLQVQVRAKVYLNADAEEQESWYQQKVYENVAKLVKKFTFSSDPLPKSKVIYAIHQVPDVDYVEDVELIYDQTKLGEPVHIVIDRNPKNIQIKYQNL
ncbi:MAG: hypothetical protein D6805_08175 [Planctomycetota bacterium]|nr:MAG: hypothetical protein D6805_08175 [Planctomycetota bacterium]